jgi:hypothetical protein
MEMGKQTDRLFNVDTIVKEYDGCRDVNFRWFYAGERLQPRPYAKLIKDHLPSDQWNYAEHYIDELFSEDEARQLKEYLDREHGSEGTTTISEVRLPCSNNMAAVSSMAVGGGNDFYMLWEEQKYSLPFKAEAYFDLVGCQLLDGSGV